MDQIVGLEESLDFDFDLIGLQTGDADLFDEGEPDFAVVGDEIIAGEILFTSDGDGQSVIRHHMVGRDA